MLRTLVPVSLIGLLAIPAAAQPLTVNFIEPEKYIDATFTHGPRADDERAEVMRAIEQHLRSLAEKRLPASRALTIDIRDIDLAGFIEPQRFGDEFRVLREASLPVITVRYRLAEGARVISEGEERIVDLNYLRRSPRYLGTDRLRYEKKMLDEWFERRIS